MSADIGELAKAIVEAKRRAEMDPTELFWLEQEEEKVQQMHKLAAEAQRAAEAASTNKEPK
jgi:hypothetical protein